MAYEQELVGIPALSARFAVLKSGYYTRIRAACVMRPRSLLCSSLGTCFFSCLPMASPMMWITTKNGSLEDSYKAVREARSKRVRVFGVTVDWDAQNYVPVIFGQNGYAVVPWIERLPTTLPAIHRSLAC